MEVVSARSALLSNFEVFTLLRELESEQLARQKTLLRVKKEEEERVAVATTLGARSDAEGGRAAHAQQVLSEDVVSENLRTVEFEAIQYLTAPHQPVHTQTPESIAQLVRDLAPYELTKAEKLQIVNLVPLEPVELYVIVEEIEDRLGDRMDEVLGIIRKSFPSSAAMTAVSSVAPTAPAFVGSDPSHLETVETGEASYDDRPGWEVGDGEMQEEYYDDLGAGAGVEGDLEMDED